MPTTNTNNNTTTNTDNNTSFCLEVNFKEYRLSLPRDKLPKCLNNIQWGCCVPLKKWMEFWDCTNELIHREKGRDSFAYKLNQRKEEIAKRRKRFRLGNGNGGAASSSSSSSASSSSANKKVVGVEKYERLHKVHQQQTMSEWVWILEKARKLFDIHGILVVILKDSPTGRNCGFQFSKKPTLQQQQQQQNELLVAREACRMNSVCSLERPQRSDQTTATTATTATTTATTAGETTATGSSATAAAAAESAAGSAATTGETTATTGSAGPATTAAATAAAGTTTTTNTVATGSATVTAAAAVAVPSSNRTAGFVLRFSRAGKEEETSWNLPRSILPLDLEEANVSLYEWTYIWDHTLIWKDHMIGLKSRQAIATTCKEKLLRQKKKISGMNKSLEFDIVKWESEITMIKASITKSTIALEKRAAALFHPKGFKVTAMQKKSSSSNTNTTTEEEFGLLFEPIPISMVVAEAIPLLENENSSPLIATLVDSLNRPIMSQQQNDLASQLERVGKLYTDGILNEKEFELAKTAILRSA